MSQRQTRSDGYHAGKARNNQEVRQITCNPPSRGCRNDYQRSCEERAQETQAHKNRQAEYQEKIEFQSCKLHASCCGQFGCEQAQNQFILESEHNQDNKKNRSYSNQERREREILEPPEQRLRKVLFWSQNGADGD
jgi:hypothetical protein